MLVTLSGMVMLVKLVQLLNTEPKSLLSYGNYVGAERDDSQTGTIPERKISDKRNTVWNGNFCKIGTILERRIPDDYDAIAYRGIGQIGARHECLISNIGNSVGNRHAGHTGFSLE
jgi:hypothetical protein